MDAQDHAPQGGGGSGRRNLRTCSSRSRLPAAQAWADASRPREFACAPALEAGADRCRGPWRFQRTAQRTAREKAVSVLRITGCTGHDQRATGVRLFTLDASNVRGNGHACEHRPVDVQQDEVKAPFFGKAQGLRAAPGELRRSRGQGEYARQQLMKRSIANHQDPWRAGARHSCRIRQQGGTRRGRFAAGGRTRRSKDGMHPRTMTQPRSFICSPAYTWLKRRRGRADTW